MNKTHLLVLLFLITQVLTIRSQEKGGLTKEAYPMAWAGNSVNTVIFRKNSLVTHDSIQFMAYYNQQGYLCLGKRTLSNELWEIRQTAYQGNIKDAHNSISIMTDGAGYLHVSWDHHGHPLNYAKSVYPLSLELGSKQSMTATIEQDVTYPEFYKLPDGNLIFMYRDGQSGKGNLVIKKYDVSTQKWHQLHNNLINGEGQRNAYWQACTDTKGIIHLSWVWRETPDVASNHDMCYARSLDGGKTWENSQGKKYQLPITAATAEYVCKIPQNSELINQTSMTTDDYGNPYIATYYKEPDNNIPQYHILFLENNQWKVLNTGFRKTAFSLKGTGTKSIPVSRPQIIVQGSGQEKQLFLIFRDEEREKKASIAVCSDTKNNHWHVCDITSYSVGDWEPTFDTELWKDKKQLHLFVQNVRQIDSEGVSDMISQPIDVLSADLNRICPKQDSFYPGNLWPDNNGVHINAHGGGILYHEGKYYWFGEHKGEYSNAALVGVTCYSSEDLYNWKNENIALPVVKNDTTSDIQEGCTIERPKVIYNKKTGKFIMYFHLELKGKGYEAARVGIAVSENATGPYKYLKSYRPNAGHWPENMPSEHRNSPIKPGDFPEWWTNEWKKAVDEGLFVRRDFENGQMSRDMALFVDDDEIAYHIYSSEENLTLHMAELSDDYLSHTGKYIRIALGGHNEAPSIFKKNGKYFMITSGCTGWAPNAARLFTADFIGGPWIQHPNPCIGTDAGLTFHSQSTFILPVTGKEDAFIFMADRWTPKKPIDGRYIWLPIIFQNGLPVLKWFDQWDLTIFDQINANTDFPQNKEGWKLIWSDEFNINSKPDSTAWSYESGFERNQELQWYQSDNAICGNGVLTITGRKEKIQNPGYLPESEDWRKNRQFAEYTSSSIKTIGKKEFQYGCFEIRARIPTSKGSWPAIWTLGKSMSWPSCGEIDLMEYYLIKDIPHILANTAWGSDVKYNAKWNTRTVPFSHFKEKDPYWEDKFHIWRMDWDENTIRIYLDEELLNETLLKDVRNGSVGNYKNPFHQPHYILLNLAIGGSGGTPEDNAFPLYYEIDYVRVYEKQ